ncbi:hypothetical protein CSA57_12300 [candidate division KSB3 bacterium]|nr:MAG: hypothetical protein CSA57_12300 [candidate division KSB3 bacterium]
MYPTIKEVSPKENYVLAVTFDNGEHGILAMKPFLDFGIFQSLKNQNTFNRVRVAFDTIEWESGADLDPAFVYEKCK